jgi:hypothetical protein
MKNRIIQMLVIFLVMCLTTASKENSTVAFTSKVAVCSQEARSVEPTDGDAGAEKTTVLSPINLFMMNIQ